MDPDPLLDLLLHGNQLKRTVRGGWQQRGVPAPESVAAHSYGVAFVSLVLAEVLPEPVNLAKVLAMAVLHDLPEGTTTDIPAPAWRYIPDGAKEAVEKQVLDEIVGETPARAGWLALWAELEAGQTLEARLVHDADKLDMYLQAWVYENATGNRRLQEFWDRKRVFSLPAAQALYNAIRERREGALPSDETP